MTSQILNHHIQQVNYQNTQTFNLSIDINDTIFDNQAQIDSYYKDDIEIPKYIYVLFSVSLLALMYWSDYVLYLFLEHRKLQNDKIDKPLPRTTFQ